MENKKGFGQAMNQILEGRGFYIVVALCAAIIGVSVWSMLRSPTPAADEQEFDEVLSDVEITPYDPVAPEVAEAEEEEEISETTETTESSETPEEAEQPAAETASDASPVWPLEGEVSRDYSMDALQYDDTMADWRTHDGLDLAAEPGTKVLAVRAGTVMKVYSDDLYGTSVLIDHGDGLMMCYANLEQIPTVYEGDAVKAGDVIGSVGDTAKCESAQGAHLHLSAVLNEHSVSPIDYLPKKS